MPQRVDVRDDAALPQPAQPFLGRGLLQITGLSMYQAVGKLIGVDLVAAPTSVLAPENLLRVAGEVWSLKNCNVFADADSLEEVTRQINGGLTGLEERRAWLGKVRAASVIVPQAGAAQHVDN